MRMYEFGKQMEISVEIQLIIWLITPFQLTNSNVFVKKK